MHLAVFLLKVFLMKVFFSTVFLRKSFIKYLFIKFCKFFFNITCDFSKFLKVFRKFGQIRNFLEFKESLPNIFLIFVYRYL